MFSYLDRLWTETSNDDHSDIDNSHIYIYSCIYIYIHAYIYSHRHISFWSNIHLAENSIICLVFKTTRWLTSWGIMIILWMVAKSCITKRMVETCWNPTNDGKNMEKPPTVFNWFLGFLPFTVLPNYRWIGDPFFHGNLERSALEEKDRELQEVRIFSSFCQKPMFRGFHGFFLDPIAGWFWMENAMNMDDLGVPPLSVNIEHFHLSTTDKFMSW